MTTLITPHIIAKEALIALENNTVLVSKFHRGFSKEYKSVGATVSIRVPASMTSTAVSDTVNTNPVTESSVDVVLDKLLDVSWELTSQELSLSVVDFSEQFIQPAMRAHAQTIDKYAAALYKDVAGHYAVNATPGVSDISGLEAVQDVLKVPLTDRNLVMNPVTKSAYMALTSFLNAEKRGDGGQALRKAEIGQVLGFDTYMDQNMPTHTTGGYAAAASVVITNTTSTVGGTIIAMKNGVQSGTLNVGDVFKVTGYDAWHVVTQAATAEGGAGTIQVPCQPPLLSAYTNNSTVTFQQTHRANLAFHKNAFAFVTAPLAPPIGGAKAAVVSYHGVSCRVVYDYAIMTKKNLISVDILCGFKTLDRNLAARLTDAR